MGYFLFNLVRTDSDQETQGNKDDVLGWHTSVLTTELRQVSKEVGPPQQEKKDNCQ